MLVIVKLQNKRSSQVNATTCSSKTNTTSIMNKNTTTFTNTGVTKYLM